MSEFYGSFGPLTPVFGTIHKSSKETAEAVRSAQTAANTAQTTAEAAQTTADAAQTASNAAQSTADAAQTRTISEINQIIDIAQANTTESGFTSAMYDHFINKTKL